MVEHMQEHQSNFTHKIKTLKQPIDSSSLALPDPFTPSLIYLMGRSLYGGWLRQTKIAHAGPLPGGALLL